MLMKSAMERGKWLFFQNCHLSPSWMPTLERLVEQIDPEKVSKRSHSSFDCLDDGRKSATLYFIRLFTKTLIVLIKHFNCYLCTI